MQAKTNNNPGQHENKTFFRSVVLFCTSLIVAGAALLSCLAAYINPEDIWVIALFGLGFFYFFLLNAFFLIVNLLRKKKMLLMHLLIFIFGIPTFFNYFQFGLINTEDETSGSSINIMSYNVRVFDLYNWSKNLETKAQMFSVIKNASPDIVCFQEFYSSTNANYRNLDSLKQLLQINEVHTLFPVFLYGTDYFGVTTFSKYPIIRKETVFYNKAQSNGAICSDISINGDTIRVYNIHLQSIKFKPEDYRYIKTIEEADGEQQVKGIVGVVLRLKRAFQIRAQQVNLLTAHIKTSPYPIMIIGDFNDTPASYTYRQLSENLKDAFKESGSGFSTTYNGAFPAFRIDYMLHDSKISSYQYQVLKDKLSDHFPLVCKLSLKK